VSGTSFTPHGRNEAKQSLFASLHRDVDRMLAKLGWDDEATEAFEDALDNGGFAPGEEDGE